MPVPADNASTLLHVVAIRSYGGYYLASGRHDDTQSARCRKAIGATPVPTGGHPFDVGTRPVSSVQHSPWRDQQCRLLAQEMTSDTGALANPLSAISLIKPVINPFDGPSEALAQRAPLLSGSVATAASRHAL